MKIKTLLKRENLCHNTYLYKKMTGRLTLPLRLIVEEATIAKITHNQDLILEVVQLSTTGPGIFEPSHYQWPRS